MTPRTSSDIALGTLTRSWRNGLTSNKMAPWVGIAPTTIRVTADCSTAELPRSKKLEPVGGLAPPIRFL